MRKTPLTKENRNRSFEYYCYAGIPIIQKHHIVPKHHGGEDISENIIEVDIREHALLHKKILEETGCKTCYKSYKSLMGMYNTWKIKSELYNDENNEIDWYRLDNHDTLKGYKSYQSGLYENREFEQPDHDVMMESINLEVNGALDTLSERERIVLEMYFGINRDNALSLLQIAEEFDMTYQWVAQIRDKAIQRLRHSSRSTTLRRYL